MEVKKQYIIKRETGMILPHYSENGCLYSRVFEGTESFLVEKKPLELIDFSTAYYGHCLKGALAAARKALGNIDMPPVKISGILGMYWFPCSSPKKNDCVWLNIEHIIDFEAVGRRTVKVTMKHGHSIELEMSFRRFIRKYHHALSYKSIMEQRAKENGSLLLLAEEGFQVVKVPSTIHYKIKKNRKRK